MVYFQLLSKGPVQRTKHSTGKLNSFENDHILSHLLYGDNLGLINLYICDENGYL